MEFASRLRWALVIITVVIALILVSWGLFSIANSIFRSGSSSNSATLIDEAFAYDVNSAATAKLIVDGPVVANQEHKSYVIEVSQNVVSMKVYSNYGQKLVSEKSYQNSEEAYETFLSALDQLDVTARLKNTNNDTDYEEQGVCATGKRYILELDNDVRRWSTSCSVKQGTAAASMRSVRLLFQKQVVDYRELVRGTGL
jgi:hypothetical protein